MQQNCRQAPIMQSRYELRTGMTDRHLDHRQEGGTASWIEVE